ncbi:MAG: ABC transporter ATP-binding protein [Rhodanobacter sp. SCN 67-45]|nr:MAG: ABC transporter ATP-binding protein [Rhodanobacter sp. SCN 67-45]
MSSKTVRIRVDGLAKRYEMYPQPSDRLKQMIFPRLHRMVRRTPKAYFNEFWALRGVSFDVFHGETVGIVGRNGSGKSTLLQMICGTIRPTLGNLMIDGRISALLELGAGFNPEFTGRENVLLSGLVYGISEAEIRAKYDEILDFSGIGQFIDQPVKTYSSGMYVRLAFAVAISVSPDILVVDEALAVGDEAFQRKCLARIEAIRDAGATVLFVSHSAGTVVELCDRAILLDKGEMLMQGTPKDVVTTYQKLLYAPADRAEQVRQEIISTYRSGSAASALPVNGCQQRESDDVGLSVDRPIPDSDPAYWEEGMLSSSTVEYERRGACIENPHVETLDGRKVNVLMPGRTYVYTYKVALDQTLARIRCGMMIRSMTGVEIGGAATSTPSSAVPLLRAGENIVVRFSFRCLLHPGVYFLNAGVLAAIGEGEEYVDRRIDAVMFRVMPSLTRLATGFVDLLDDGPQMEVV